MDWNYCETLAEFHQLTIPRSYTILPDVVVIGIGETRLDQMSWFRRRLTITVFHLTKPT
jgi:hypothetical protein